MKAIFHTFLLLLISVFFIGCSNNKKKETKDDILAGELNVVVDESILPIIEEQKEVFESSYYNAKVTTNAKPEVQAINSLLKGEAPVAILTRKLTPEEDKGFKQRSISPRIYSLGFDGIVFVANEAATDSGVVIKDIEALMKGNKVKNYSLVFDNLNSSAFRYLKDLGKIEKVANTYVLSKDSAKNVLDEVAADPNKIGVISFNQYLSLESSFTKRDKIRILSVLNDKLGTPKYVKPSQASLSTDEYPLKREIFVLNYQPNMGLGIGFSAFMTGDRGQRIMLKAGLLPATMPGREIIIRDNIN